MGHSKPLRGPEVTKVLLIAFGPLKRHLYFAWQHALITLLGKRQYGLYKAYPERFSANEIAQLFILNELTLQWVNKVTYSSH